ncbi:MAG TPA: ABC transporter permease subunit, partial [Reyranella sp.]|nr:ABC transporter permease subunit [Reyranella sp.]
MPRSAGREGSPFTGVGPVFVKELSDHLSSVRMLVLTLFVIVFGAFPVASSLQQLRTVVGADAYLYLRIFTIEPEQVPIPFVQALGFIIPIMAIGLGFDLVNSEFNRRTLSRVLSQP